MGDDGGDYGATESACDSTTTETEVVDSTPCCDTGETVTGVSTYADSSIDEQSFAETPQEPEPVELAPAAEQETPIEPEPVDPAPEQEPPVEPAVEAESQPEPVESQPAPETVAPAAEQETPVEPEPVDPAPEQEPPVEPAVEAESQPEPVESQPAPETVAPAAEQETPVEPEPVDPAPEQEPPVEPAVEAESQPEPVESQPAPETVAPAAEQETPVEPEPVDPAPEQEPPVEPAVEAESQPEPVESQPAPETVAPAAEQETPVEPEPVDPAPEQEPPVEPAVEAESQPEPVESQPAPETVAPAAEQETPVEPGIEANPALDKTPNEDTYQWDRFVAERYCNECEHQAVMQLDGIDGVSVDRQEEVWVKEPDGTERNGRIDLLIDGSNVVDFKSDNMSNWGPSDARALGDQYGQQVRGYMDSPDLPGDTQGFLYMVGRDATDPSVEQAFVDAAAQHGVEVKFVRGDGSHQSVVDALEDHFWNGN